MSDSATFNLTFDEAETFETTMTQTVEVVTSDHTKLINREVNDQHPINAITNLNTELANRVVSGNALTNMEIEELLGGD